ncbi:MAG: CYTH domain-containing protein [Trichloromonadaceae bacterium]
MAEEIERKFLVSNDSWRPGASGTLFRQGYLSTDPERTVRVRLEGERGVLTIKGLSRGIRRAEFEYPIPAAEAAVLLDTLCLQPLIEKTRYRVEHAGHLWEIDEFAGDNAGLLLAEVELSSEDEAVELPLWVGAEVSSDPRYFNANLIRHPFRRW